MDSQTKGKYYRIAGLLLAILIVLGAAATVYFLKQRGSNGQVIPTGANTPVAGGSESTAQAGETGLSIFLSEGGSQPQLFIPLPRVTGEPLSDEEIALILARLPALPVDPADQQQFKFPQALLPPPRTGETIVESFPPPPEEASPGQVDTGPLQVLRYSPEGEIPIAPFVNVTFNQPMVPLATLGDLSVEEVPVIVEPDLPGTWRWLGTKTLNFQYESDLIDRMPMATAYQVTIPAGTTSATGGVLAESVQFSFRTPTPTLIRYYPTGEAQPLDTLFFIAFDQRVNPGGVLETIQVRVRPRTLEPGSAGVFRVEFSRIDPTFVLRTRATIVKWQSEVLESSRTRETTARGVRT